MRPDKSCHLWTQIDHFCRDSTSTEGLLAGLSDYEICYENSKMERIEELWHDACFVSSTGGSAVTT